MEAPPCAYMLFHFRDAFTYHIYGILVNTGQPGNRTLEGIVSALMDSGLFYLTKTHFTSGLTPSLDCWN